MKFVVVFAIIAAWVSVSSGQDPVTCDRISSCTPDVSQFQGSNNQQDIAKACKSVKDAMQCFRDAMADCRKNMNIPEDTIKKLEAEMDNYDKLLQGQCGSNGAGALKMTALTLVSTFLALIL